MQKKQDEELENSSVGFFFLFLYSIAIFIRPHEWNYTTVEPIPLGRYLLIAAFVFYLFFQKKKIWGYQCWCLLGVFLIIPLSGLKNGWLGGGVFQAIDFFIYSLLPFLLYASLINSSKKHHAIFLVFTVASLVMLHHGISQKMSVDGTGWSGIQLSVGTRITFLGFFKDPNDLSMFFVMNIPVMFYLRHSATNWFSKFFFSLMIIALLVGIYLANSRGAMVALFGLGLTYCFFNWGKLKTLFFSLVSIPIVVIIMSVFRTIDLDDGSTSGRIRAWYQAIQMFKSSPLIGVGKENFDKHHSLTAHNSFLLIIAELGAIGYALWFFTIALTMWMLYKAFNLEPEKNKGILADPKVRQDVILAKTLFFSLVAFLYTAFFLSRSYIVFLYVFLGLSYAVFIRLARQIPELQEVTASKNLLLIFMAAPLTMILLYLLVKILL
ncbi:O-antigen ligase family protein [Thalassotalea fonticola]|uniref:O-antigen ligase family protein n=1 Tax=Thalassotalea fonticola TaxID=3065649 RepID=A0ABZ0GLM7_9GAMM|nr:O-antigen ligase family protein [Colwelliaceae bacterium S1-1]